MDDDTDNDDDDEEEEYMLVRDSGVYDMVPREVIDVNDDDDFFINFVSSI